MSRYSITDARSAADAPFMDVLRSLVRTYHAFLARGSRHIRTLGLTSSQFDVIATLDNTDGMRLTQLAERTLVTKSALTSIIDRLEKRDLVTRRGAPGDRRVCVAHLTPAGEALFDDIFPRHIKYLTQFFERLEPETLERMQIDLDALRTAFDAPAVDPPPLREDAP